jgi:uncharacterized protein YfaS (alpha-2-macroglobulin family)
MLSYRTSALFLVVAAGIGFWGFSAAQAPRGADLAKLARQQFQNGNVKDAFASYRSLLTDPTYDGVGIDEHLANAVQCLNRLNRVPEADALLEDTAKAHVGKWRILAAVARGYGYVRKDGFIVAGKFERGSHRGGGEYAMAGDRDRVRALQLLAECLPLVADESDASQAAHFYFQLGDAFLNQWQGPQAWRLQELTDLTKLPDYELGYGYGGAAPGAPVDEEGNPIYYRAPESFEEAANDGERRMWALDQAVKVAPDQKPNRLYRQAEFLQSQFGVETMAQFGYWFNRSDDEDKPQTFALDTLTDEETIARLATGVKRFKLPDDQNPIKAYQELAELNSAYAEHALERLAQNYENRRQYPKAADHWRRLIEKHRDPNGHRAKRLEQIVGEWGEFDGEKVSPAGRGAELAFRFRNAKRVQFTAQSIKVDEVLTDVKAYLKSSPRQIDWNRIQIDNIGYRIVTENQQKYLAEHVADWSLDLEPREAHFDRRITVSTPLQKAGAYLVTAKVEGGNTTRIVVWIADTVIVKKPIDGKQWIYVADAVSGTPVAKANVEFFGYRQQQVEVPLFGRSWRIETANFAELTDADGQVRHDFDEKEQQYQWLMVARTDDGRLAHYGFSHVWRGQYYDQRYEQTKAYGITDRPVYRPEQKVQYKFWIGQSKYDAKNEPSPYAEQNFELELTDPQGTSVWKKTVKSDRYGGIAGEHELPGDAKLGAYQLTVHNYGGLSFRVEEYKKPEYEVTVDAPSEPVALGEKVTATLKAKYYFGAPVTEAKVKYKVLRTKYDARWYPIGRWDWLYGRGYWWFGYDYEWYPGWNRWGCLRPIAWWYHGAREQPEVVAERETEIGADGTLKIEIDTTLAKEIHGDSDHRYEITAEVVDQSRRTIVGMGKVLVARAPFKVFAWVDRGHYNVGDTVHASFSAHTLDDKPVKGKGKLRLLSVGYDAERKPIETPVQEWDVDTDGEGHAAQTLVASKAGQYRLAYELTDAAGHKQEGAYVFTVRGEGFDGADFRFNHVELVPDKREYAPGEKVRLMVNTDRADSTVLLFVRPSNGIYLPPQILRMKGKSTQVEIDVELKDMPNFFVEAVTVADGMLHAETKEIVVPPESRVVDVTVTPSATEYKPGEKAEIKLSLVGPDGRAFVGQTVVAVYDKSVEYVSGGSNVAEIREYFWKWRRHHYPRTESNLERYFGPIHKNNEVTMGFLGVFGATVADELRDGEGFGKDKANMARGRAAGGGVPLPAAPMAAKASSADAAPASETAGYAMNGLADRKSESQSAAAPGGAGGEAGNVEPTVRSNFADTALWVAALETNSDGIATVKLDMPENLTTWKIRTWAMGAGNAVGESSSEVVTTKNLLVRLQAPRFFVETDEVVISANVHNYLKTDKRVEARLEFDGSTLENPDEAVRTVMVKADGETRVDWRVKVVREGEAVVRVKGLTDEESDAMEMKFPVYVHGMLKTDSYSGALRPADAAGKLTYDVPEDRNPEQSRLEVRYSPTLAGAMVDALPYLADYPYGCTEQTLSRFLPTVITRKVLIDMGLDLREIRRKRTNLNAQEIGDDKKRAEQWKRFDRNPVFSEETVEKMVKGGVQRLTDMQCADGGWGWFSGYGEHSYPHTTAYVVHGFQIAGQYEVALVPGVLERGIEWLKRYQDEQVELLNNWGKKNVRQKQRADDLDAFVFMVLVDADHKDGPMLKYLERDRARLSVYALSMYGTALHKLGETEKLAEVMKNISQYVVEDDENQTAYLNLGENNYWWYWYGSENESMAYYLKLLARVDPQSRVASRMVKYLLNNRKNGTYWKSTRDTALCIEALADYLKASGESKPNLTVEVWLDGKKRQEVKIDADNLFTFDNSFVLTGDDVESGRHTLELRKQGEGPLYYNAYVTNFTKEDFITKAGLEVKVERKYYKLKRVDATATVAGARGQAVKQKVEKYEREELTNFATLTSGDLVEIELEIESKNDYEYLVFEDMKAAGFETVDVRSGYNGNSLGAYMELRDERVALFTRELPRGKHSLSYRVRAEIPGKFSALPTKASAMYAPELRANSDEIKLKIVDAE